VGCEKFAYNKTLRERVCRALFGDPHLAFNQGQAVSSLGWSVCVKDANKISWGFSASLGIHVVVGKSGPIRAVTYVVKPKDTEEISDEEISKLVSKVKGKIARNIKAQEVLNQSRKEAYALQVARAKLQERIVLHFQKLGVAPRLLNRGDPDMLLQFSENDVARLLDMLE
jgi:hypothetical protein